MNLYRWIAAIEFGLLFFWLMYMLYSGDNDLEIDNPPDQL